ncbi:MAG: DoxX family protein [Nitrospinota bacterium]
MQRRVDRFRDFGAALLRLVLGAYYLLHGYYAGAVIGVPALAEANAQVYGVPFPLLSAWLVVLGHAVGGLMLLIGAWPRVGALLNVPVMAGAVMFAHAHQGFFIRGEVVNAAQGRAVAAGYEYALFLLLATVASAFLGGGMFTLGSSRKGGRIPFDLG